MSCGRYTDFKYKSYLSKANGNVHKNLFALKTLQLNRDKHEFSEVTNIHKMKEEVHKKAVVIDNKINSIVFGEVTPSNDDLKNFIQPKVYKKDAHYKGIPGYWYRLFSNERLCTLDDHPLDKNVLYHLKNYDVEKKITVDKEKKPVNIKHNVLTAVEWKSNPFENLTEKQFSFFYPFLNKEMETDEVMMWFDSLNKFKESPTNNMLIFSEDLPLPEKDDDLMDEDFSDEYYDELKRKSNKDEPEPKKMKSEECKNQ
ncbi:Nucleosome assembly protein [Entamoeba marina]